MNRAPVAALLLFTVGSAPAQQTPPATFRTSTELVQVNVVAEDKLGKPVADLRREDFQILDNGSPQEISLFLSETEKANTTPPEPPPPNTFTNRKSLPGSSRSGYSVIMIDTLFTGLANENQGGSGAIWAIQKGLGALRAIPPGDSIAIYATGAKLWVVRDFTRDHEALEHQLRTWKPVQDVIPLENKGDVLRFDVQQLAAQLESIPGRKNLIWIAESFPLRPASVQQLKIANVALYPVDAHGSTIGLPSEKAALAAPLRALAAMTGGVAYFDRDDLDVAIRDALEDGHGYTLGFYPAVADDAPTVHQLAVRVVRPGVILRYRNAYRSQGSQTAPINPKKELVEALSQPADATGILVRATATRSQDRLNLDAMLDADSLELKPQGDRWSGKIEIGARFTTADGKIASVAFAQTLTLNLRQATYDNLLRAGFVYRNSLKIPPKAVQVKLLFANLATGKIGTLTIPLSEVRETVASAK